MTIFDISQLSEQNDWWIDKKNIMDDFKLSQLKNLQFQWDPALRHYLNLEKDVIFTIRGPRQVGKTTMMKIVIRDLLLNKRVAPEDVFYWSFERNDSKELNDIIRTYLNWRIESKSQRKYLFLDEICAVKDWRKELIYFANKGDFKNCSIVVTGSHSMDLKHSTELMPGRRGGDGENPLDKILLPMKFSEFAKLVSPNIKNKLFDLNLVKATDRKKKIIALLDGKIDKTIENLILHKKQIDSLFELYLITGGIPSAINELKTKNKLTPNLYNIYLQAIIGDLHRYGYKEHYFKQMIREIFVGLSNPVSWNSFTKSTDIRHHDTVQDYATAMEELYIANLVFRCSIHDGRIHSFLKKMYISDPFIFHALHGWSNNKKDYFVNAKENIFNLETKSKLVEGVVYNHLCRFAYSLNPRDLFDPKDTICYYEDKSKKEVDFVLLHDGEYYPFEVKYQSKISNSDFYGFRSFKKGVMISKNELGNYMSYTKIPVSIFLLLI